MRIVLFGQAAFGKDVFEALRAAGEQVVGVSTPRQGTRPDPLFEAASIAGVPVIETPTLRQDGPFEQFVALKPDLLVSIPLNGQTTASAYKKIHEAGTKVVFIDQAVDGMDPGKDYAAIISSDNLALGMYLADTLAESLGGKGDEHGGGVGGLAGHGLPGERARGVVVGDERGACSVLGSA